MSICAECDARKGGVRMNDEDLKERARLNELLRERILRRMPRPGQLATEIDGLKLTRREAVNQAENCFGTPCVAVIIQGEKCTLIGSREYRYGENQYIVTGVDMPSAFYVVNPRADRPFLAMSLDIDPYLLTQLAADVPPPAHAENRQCRGAAIGEAGPDMLDAFLRLMDVLDRPERREVLAPMIIRELHYLLLIGPQGENLRQLHTLGTRGNQIAQAIAWLKGNYRQTLQVDALARRVHMATSTFHRHFKEVTGLSPLQYHKRLRLYEAQRLMLTEDHTASSASLAVGYESGTQFNREYKRLFGEPPHRDMAQRRFTSPEARPHSSGQPAKRSV